MINPHYDPAGCGLINLGALDQSGLSYEFNILAVWCCKTSKRLFYATDSGCSCPSPFEGYHFRGPDDTNLTPITEGDSWSSFVREVEDFPVPQVEREDLIAVVRQALPQGTSL